MLRQFLCTQLSRCDQIHRNSQCCGKLLATLTPNAAQSVLLGSIKTLLSLDLLLDLSMTCATRLVTLRLCAARKATPI